MTLLAGLSEIQPVLHAYRDFLECIVERIEWADFGTTVTIAFDYIWNADGSVRPDNEQRLLVSLTLHRVEEFEVSNKIPPAVLEEPSELGWSFSEVARAQIARDDRSCAYDRGGIQFCTLTILRESGPWIRIVFAEMEVSESDAGPLESPWG